jgi:hypothetical protein
MLEAGGLPILTDQIRTADEDNPKGYYEYEQVKKIKEDPAVLEKAGGKVVKIISELLLHVPQRYHCNVIFMRRRMEEILASQQQMLLRRGSAAASPETDHTLAALFHKHLRRVQTWIPKQPHMRVIYISYNELLETPAAHIDQINRFLGQTLDTQRMSQSIDYGLYRQRAG